MLWPGQAGWYRGESLPRPFALGRGLFVPLKGGDDAVDGDGIADIQRVRYDGPT